MSLHQDVAATYEFTDVESSGDPAEMPIAAAEPDTPPAEPVKKPDAKPADTPPADGETPKDDDVDDKAASEAAKQLAKHGSSLERRKGKLTADINDLTYRKRQTERELAELEAKRDALKPKDAPRPADEGVDPDDPEPTAEQYEDYDKLIVARAEWAARKAFRAERARIERASADRAQLSALHQVYTQGRAKHADFDAVLEQQANEGIRWSPLVTQVVLTHPDGAEIAYALAKDPDKALELSALRNPIELGIAVGALIAGLAAAPPRPSDEPAPGTNAKPPIKPVGGSPVASDEPENIDDLPFGPEYVRKANERDRKAQRRL